MNDTTPLDTAPLEPAGEPPRGRQLRPLALGIIGGVAAAALASGGIALASTTGAFSDDRLIINSSASPDDHDLSASPNPTSTFEPISDDLRAAIEAAALEAVGGGTVVEVRRGDDPGEAYRVTVRLANGDLAEVRLADDLSVLRVKLDNSDSDDDSDDVSDDDSGSNSDDDGTDDQGSGHDDSDDDHSGSGSDDSSGSGSGSDDSGSDDSGSGGHGSDD
jgi:hypothetical protein